MGVRVLVFLGSLALAWAACSPGRPVQRKFVSVAVDQKIAAVADRMLDKELACIFSNTLPNTLDTTVYQQGKLEGKDDTFVVTGDIEAMWLRDSMNQVQPYMQFASTDEGLKSLLRGLVNRQTLQVNTDVYANAHNYNAAQGTTPHTDDHTTKPSFLGTRVDAMTPLIFERKYELDTLCAFLKLSRTYYAATNDTGPFGPAWLDAVDAVLTAMREMQAATSEYVGTYVFQRCSSCEPSDTISHGVGWPAPRTGLIRSYFRPSDDANLFPFNIPANAMAVVELHGVSSLLLKLGQSSLSDAAARLANEVDAAIDKFGKTTRAPFSEVYAYEVDGYGNALFMDDANVPSLLSLPYLGYVSASDPLYQRTRSAVLSAANPYFFSGRAGNGTGGPHNGIGWVWPMSIAMRAFTSTDDNEIRMCLGMLRDTTAGTGFMHESFWLDNAGQYTRPWFAWANSFFGELILHLAETRPHILFG